MKAKYLFTVLMLMGVSLIMAQPTGPGPGDGNGSPFDAPIGQGVAYAMILALGYGVKAIKKKHN